MLARRKDAGIGAGESNYGAQTPMEFALIIQQNCQEYHVVPGDLTFSGRVFSIVRSGPFLGNYGTFSAPACPRFP
jgi:hypothetical protein